MIKSFNKEEFLAQPMEVRVEQETNTAYDLQAEEDISSFPSNLEQTIVLNIGGTDYDLRQLVYSIFDLEAKVDRITEKIERMQEELQSQIEFVTYKNLDNRISPLEFEISDLYNRLESIDSK